MNYLLQYPLSETDIDFLNETSIAFEIVDTGASSLAETITGLNEDRPELHDSGWCDAATGARIIHEFDRAVFKDVSPEDLTFLMVRYSSRLKLLTPSMQNIYSYRDDI